MRMRILALLKRTDPAGKKHETLFYFLLFFVRIPGVVLVQNLWVLSFSMQIPCRKNNLEMLSQFQFWSRSMENLTQSRYFPIEDSTLFYTASRGRE